MSTTSFTDGGLYVLMYAQTRLDDTAPGGLVGFWHWALYHHQTCVVLKTTRGPTLPVPRGQKYHIRGDPGRWLLDSSTATGIMGDMHLVAIILIGVVEYKRHCLDVGQIVKQNDGDVNSRGVAMTCRIYVLEALARLMESGYIARRDMNIVEKRIFTLADEYRGAVEAPPPDQRAAPPVILTL